ncbi:MAG: hypothetical protein LBP88_07860 [Treponema sp.]|jgi:hypothetical protein|nr:hypothetical protein [Treponema sp.]
MSKQNKAVYAPGELGRIREKLGTIDEQEAKRMAKLLGGEVGIEKSPAPKVSVPRRPAAPRTQSGAPNTRSDPSQTRGSSVSAPRGGQAESARKKKVKNKPVDTGDDPQVPVKVSYSERLKMDRYAAQAEFDIKSIRLVLASMFSFFKEAPDLVSPLFVTQRLNEYYKQIELLVISTRTMFPRNNLRRNEQLKKMSLFVFSVLDTIRYWNIERITNVMARIQSHPRQVRTIDCADLVRDIYRPLFILEKLSIDFHITEAYKLLYKFLYIENPIEAKEKYQKLIRSALDAYTIIRKEIQYLLYPLFLKLVSDKWIPYEHFFSARKNRIMAFLGVKEEDRISPNVQPVGGNSADGNSAEDKQEPEPENAQETERKAAARQAEDEGERKALERGLRILESLFPKAGWDRLATYPDLYRYFAKIFDLGRGYELIAPTDPLLQVVILMRILEELFSGLRYVSFSTIFESGESAVPLGETMEDILENWRNFDATFNQEYLGRLQEYCRLLDTSTESRTSPYAKRIYNELQWIKRLYYLPYYKIENFSSSPFKKSSITPVYPEVRKLRHCLSTVAAKIEGISKQEGGGGQGVCEGIENPWAPYVFQVSNPLSMRLNMLLGAKKRNNASLVYFTLAVATVLDHLINNYNSWAYGSNEEPLFRSVNGEGTVPQFGVDDKLDANAIFKQVIQERRAAGKKN